MTIGSLFSGIGGLELGLEAAGLGFVVWQVEQDAFCRAVLAKHWPGVDRSVTDVRAAQSLPRVGLICGGFPCQDVSGAGKGAGLAGERSGLWFAMRDTIAALRPRAVVVENVASGKRRWLCQVRTDLHALGYRTRAVQVSAAECGAPHRRERVFVLALADAIGDLIRLEQGRSGGAGGTGAAEFGQDRGREAESSMGGECHGLPVGLDAHRWPAGRGEEQHGWEPPRTIGGPPKGYHADLEGEEIARFVDMSRNRRARLRALGNAVVPHQARAAGLVLRDWLREASS